MIPSQHGKLGKTLLLLLRPNASFFTFRSTLDQSTTCLLNLSFQNATEEPGKYMDPSLDHVVKILLDDNKTNFLRDVVVHLRIEGPICLRSKDQEDRTFRASRAC